MKREPSFTHEHYESTLMEYLDAGYFVGGFREILQNPDKEKLMILRHDIDTSLDMAFNIAEIDHRCGIKSSFFIRVHATGYNPFTLSNYRLLKRMMQMGHEVGLHVEPSIPDVLQEDPLQFCDRQKASLEAAIGRPIIGMSTHEPVRMGDPELIEKLVDRWGLEYHAYEKRFFEDIKYISDSGARWREGCFSTWVDKVDKIQVLTHPFWWFKEISQENY